MRGTERTHGAAVIVSEWLDDGTNAGIGAGQSSTRFDLCWFEG
jgi:hypothetical protein